MKRSDLEHVLRAAAAITGETEFVVLGSQAVLVQYSAPPDDMLVSVEADLYPRHKPDMAELIDGSIGRESPFHSTFGYYADGVDETTAKLPAGWADRAVRYSSPNTGGAVAIAPELHDLAVSKLIAGRDKDLAWVAVAVRAGLADPSLLIARIAETDADETVKTLAIQRAERLESR